jgi:aminopeptidase N
MRTDSVTEYVRLHRELTEERGRIRERLRQIDEALGQLTPVSISAVQGAATNRGPVPTTIDAAHPQPRSRRLSTEARQRIAEAQRRRWAAFHKEQSSGLRDGARRLARRIGKATRVPHT